MEQLDLNQIRTFVRLVQTGSFTKAAEVLRQPKSRVSRRLASLERDLGAQLIYRTTRQFQLTEVGRNFYDRAKNLIEGLESLSNEVSEGTAEVSGLIKVTASDDMGVKHLPTILDEFSRLYPQVRFELLLSQAYVDLVKESIDVAIRIGTLKDSSLRVRKVGTVKSIIVASPGFIERYRHYEDLNQIEKLPFVGMTSMQKIETLKGSDGKKFSFKPNLSYSANNPAMLVELALLGKGIAYVPEFLCADHIKSGRLLHIHRNLRGVEAAVNIVTPEQKEVPLKVKKFSEFVGKRLRDLLTTT
ncbi:LysR family transcriptional regulator [Bdellovibrio reynosensis]|uniref:LysR family transcriptional regulator n=1 Tax=Bdellovibrio reynosensis TaxID=2835041 RepID=A0ABY4CGA4_9BACT|nr:LysR family transcriptional regulator [Bdellovibrio reynosensis]UOF02831.1 LysR family transcriptional regulator [Bdellovibrio reynosensis]